MCCVQVKLLAIVSHQSVMITKELRFRTQRLRFHIFLKFLHLVTFFSELILKFDGYFVVRITRARHVRISATMKIMVYLALPLMLTDWAC